MCTASSERFIRLVCEGHKLAAASECVVTELATSSHI